MFEESIRPMNDRERAFLEACITQTAATVTLTQTVKWVGIWASGLFLCALLALGLTKFAVNPILGGIGGGLVVSAGIVCLFAIIMLITSDVHWRRYHREFLRHDVPQIVAALEDGRVSVKRVATNAVIELEEFEDEGAGYIFDVGAGKILFLKGQRFIAVDDDMEWPSTEFEIVRTVSGDRWVGIFCSGRRLEPVRVIPLAECKEEIAWADDREEILEANVNDFAESLRNQS